MTDHCKEIARLACLVVLETPERSSYAMQSYVRRSLIRDLEYALVAAGFDLKTMKANLKQIKKERAS